MSSTPHESSQQIASGNDVFGYDQHMRHYALRVATGIAVIIAGFACGSFFALLPERNTADLETIVRGLDRIIGLMTKDLVDLPKVQHHPETFIIEILGVLIGYTILKHASEDQHDYMRAFRRIEPFYSKEAKRHGYMTQIAYDVLGIAIIVIIPTLLAHFASNAPVNLVNGFTRLACAIGVWFIVYGTHMGMRTNLFRYNFRALRLVNIYELGKSESDAEREIRLGEKRLCDWSSSLTNLAWGVGVLGALGFYFLPTMRTNYFWIPLVITLIVTVIIKWIIIRYAQRTYEPDFE